MVVLFIRAWANAPFIEEHALSISEYVRVIDLSIEIDREVHLPELRVVQL